MRKLKLDDIIIEKEVFDDIGKEIIIRWKNGEGSWLDFVDLECKSQPYYLDFNTIMKQEKVLDKIFDRLHDKNANEDDYISCVVLLDSLYSTQLKNPTRVGESICDFLKGSINEINAYNNIVENDEAINLVKKVAEIDKDYDNGTYIYSFATKFVSRLNKNFPIFDRYTAGLIYRYLNDGDSGEKTKLSLLGDYSKYTQTYDKLLKKYNIELSEEITYKEIDVCMWSFAKIRKLAWDDDVRKDITYIPRIKQ